MSNFIRHNYRPSHKLCICLMLCETNWRQRSAGLVCLCLLCRRLWSSQAVATTPFRQFSLSPKIIAHFPHSMPALNALYMVFEKRYIGRHYRRQRPVLKVINITAVISAVVLIFNGRTEGSEGHKCATCVGSHFATLHHFSDTFIGPQIGIFWELTPILIQCST